MDFIRDKILNINEKDLNLDGGDDIVLEKEVVKEEPLEEKEKEVEVPKSDEDLQKEKEEEEKKDLLKKNIQQAKEKISKKDFKAAISILNTVLEKDPENESAKELKSQAKAGEEESLKKEEEKTRELKEAELNTAWENTIQKANEWSVELLTKGQIEGKAENVFGGIEKILRLFSSFGIQKEEEE